jgi:CheY-like chemotaxis protein
MDGTTATMRIRELNKIIPIIALTATTDENLTSTLYQKGFTDLVQKPFVPEDLHNKINNAMGNLVIG